MAIPEKVMNYAPGHVSTEPLQRTVGNIFIAPAKEAVPHAGPPFTRPWTGDSASQPLRQDQGTVLPAELQVAPAASPTSPQEVALAHDLPAQIDQLRNDIFGIAMNVSALNDRLDRMEQRLPQAGQSMQAGITALRGEMETWLESHLSAAVEHCMHQIISRNNSSDNRSVN